MSIKKEISYKLPIWILMASLVICGLSVFFIFRTSGKFQKEIEATHTRYETIFTDLHAELLSRMRKMDFATVRTPENSMLIQTLVNKVDELSLQHAANLSASDNRISRELNNLNVWVTIWMGLLAFAAIFIPIVINTETRRSMEAVIADYKAELHKLENSLHQDQLYMDLSTTSLILKTLINIPHNTYLQEERIQCFKDTLCQLLVCYNNINHFLKEKKEIPDRKFYEHHLYYIVQQTLISIKQVSLVFEEREILKTTDEFHRLGLSLSNDLRNKEKGEEDLHTLFDTFNGKLSAITTLIENHINTTNNNNN